MKGLCGPGPRRGSIEIAPLTYFAILSTLLLARSVRFGSGLPSSFEVDEEADAAVLPQGEALKKLMRKSGRYQKLDDPKGIWGYESYCVDGVVSLDPPPPVARPAPLTRSQPLFLSLSHQCGYYTPAPKCQGECRKYYPDGGLGLSS